MAAPDPTWYRRKNYPHFDLPLSGKAAVKLAANPGRVTKHAFLPFLSFAIKTRQFSGGSKKREIRFASHRDSYIYAYYGYQLAQKYEGFLESNGLKKTVLAYRAKIGNNADFANEAFDRIHGLADCVAIGFDIEKYFDTLNHRILKDCWTNLLAMDRLPDDHFVVFKSITSYGSVDRALCYRTLGYSKEQIQSQRPICSFPRFRDVVRGRKSSGKSLIRKNMSGKGIPQGSSISAILSNIYLSSFDIRMLKLVELLGGIYRRYCDDILVVVPPAYELAMTHFVTAELRKMKLKVNSKKTTISHFLRCPDGHVSLRHGDKPFQYLGFVFNGHQRLIRSQTLSRYWRKVTKAIKRAKAHAKRSVRLKRNSALFKRTIFERYTHKGQRNFITYAKHSASTMTPGGAWQKSPCWGQVKNHAAKINRLLR